MESMGNLSPIGKSQECPMAKIPGTSTGYFNALVSGGCSFPYFLVP